MIPKIVEQLLLIMAFLILLVLIKINFLDNQSHQDDAMVKASIFTTSSQLLEAYKTDEALANHNYLKQLVAVSGTLQSIEQNGQDSILVIGDTNTFETVRCHLLPKEANAIQSLKKGEQVTIKGICSGYLMDVILVNCSVTDQT